MPARARRIAIRRPQRPPGRAQATGATSAAAARPANVRSRSRSSRAHHAAPLPASSNAASWTPIMKRRKKMSPLPGITLTSDPNVARPNESSRHAASASHDGARARLRPKARERQRQTDRGEQRHDRDPAMVEQLARCEPAQHAPGAVAVRQRGPAERLVGGRPRALVDQRHDHPGGGEQRPPGDGRRPARARDERPAGDERPQQQRHERQVAGLEVQRDRQRHERDRREQVAAVTDRAPAEAPGQRQRQRGPQLGPDSEPDPQVRVRLVADPGPAHQERRHRGRRARGGPSRSEQARAQVHAHRPQRQEQVERPPVGRVGADGEAGQPGEHRRQALVMEELRRAQAEEREPALERQMPGAKLSRREPDHLLVDGAVVEVGDPERLRPQAQQVPGDRRDDQQPRASRGGPVAASGTGVSCCRCSRCCCCCRCYRC